MPLADWWIGVGCSSGRHQSFPFGLTKLLVQRVGFVRVAGAELVWHVELEMKLIPRVGSKSLIIGVSILGLICSWVYHSLWRPLVIGDLARGCFSNQNSIDRLIGVWEAQNEQLRVPGEPLVIEFDSTGRIVTMSGFSSEQLSAYGRMRPPLAIGSTAILDFCKDPSVFICPQTSFDADSKTNRSRLICYRWTMWSGGPAGSHHRRAKCIAFDDRSPGSTEGLEHRISAAREN